MKARLTILLTIAILAGLVLNGCSGKKDEGVDINMFVWAGANQGVVPIEVVEKYTADNPNVKVEITEGSNAVMYPQIVAHRQVDPDNPLIHFGYFNVDGTTKGHIEELWLPFDPKNVPNIENIMPQFRQPNDVGINWGLGQIVLLYNTNMVSEPPTSWTDLWSNPKFKGRVAMWDNMFYTFLVMAARLNGGDENNIDPAFEVWSNNVDMIHSLVTSSDQLKNLFATNEVWLAPFFLGQQMVWEEEGAPIGGALPKEGVIAFPMFYQIVKGTTPEEKKVIEEIVNELLTPENLARYADLCNAIPTAAGVTLPDRLAANPFFSEEVVSGAIQFDWHAIAQNHVDWQDRWDREVKSKMK